ncbi:MAG TPA: TolC family protein, partial [Longimicrobiaceae bacterium]|nr:TolC family protein [Longimicrobiaceae bacterium]
MRKALSNQFSHARGCMRIGMLVMLALMVAMPAVAQDTLRLPALQEAALASDARAGQRALRATTSGLRMDNLGTERLPQVTFRGEASYQSEVPGIPISIAGMEIPLPPKDRYAATLEIEQLLYDGGALEARREMEAARLRSELAELAATLYPLRVEVNERFFAALLLQNRMEEVDALITDLEARLELLRAQVREGAALPADTATVLAEILRARQQKGEAAVTLRSTLAALGQLTGRRITSADYLALPDLTTEVVRARALMDPGDSEASPAARVHPRFEVFAAERERLELEAGAIDARARPRVSAFGRFGYGRPGLAQFTDEFHDYWIAGVR